MGVTLPSVGAIMAVGRDIDCIFSLVGSQLKYANQAIRRVSACLVAGFGGGGQTGGPGGGGGPGPSKHPCCDRAQTHPLSVPTLSTVRAHNHQQVPNPNTAIFTAAFTNAYNRLTHNETCCSFYSGGDPVQTLQSATWGFQHLGRPSIDSNGTIHSIGAATYTGTPGTVWINYDGPFINPSHMLVIGGTGSPFRDMSHGMRDDDFRALLILHELGHLTGQFGPDTGNTANLNVSAGIKQQHFRRFCSSKEQTHWRGRGTHSTSVSILHA